MHVKQFWMCLCRKGPPPLPRKHRRCARELRIYAEAYAAHITSYARRVGVLGIREKGRQESDPNRLLLIAHLGAAIMTL